MKKLKIVVVDDTEGVARSLASSFSSIADSAKYFTRPEDALNYLRNTKKIDLVITDHIMPGMKGLELIKEAKAIHPELKFIILTGYTEGEIIDNLVTPSMRMGVSMIYHKPVLPETLISDVELLVANTKMPTFPFPDTLKIANDSM